VTVTTVQYAAGGTALVLRWRGGELDGVGFVVPGVTGEDFAAYDRAMRAGRREDLAVTRFLAAAERGVPLADWGPEHDEALLLEARGLREGW
jgi:hypothetical protein